VTTIINLEAIRIPILMSNTAMTIFHDKYVPELRIKNI
jgi:hypothetical protein